MTYLLLGILVLSLVSLLGVGAVIYELVWGKPDKPDKPAISSYQLWYVVGRRVDGSVLFRVFYCTSADKALEIWGGDFDHTWKIILVTTDYEKMKEKVWPVPH